MSTAGLASAQDVEALMSEGLRLRQEGHDAEAVERFRQAHEQGGGAVALAQLALAEQALGRWVDSANHLEEALRDSTDRWIERHRRELSTALQTIHSHLGEIEIDGNMQGARVRIDGREVGQLPIAGRIRVEAGSMIVEAEAEGHYTVQRQVTVRPGGLARVSLVLVARTLEPPTEPPDSAQQRPRTEPPASLPPRRVARPRRIPRTPLGDPMRDFYLAGAIGGFALTAIALAGVIAAIAIYETNIQIWNDDSRCSPFGPGRDVNCPAEGAAWRTAYDWGVASAIVGGVTLAAGVTCTVLFGISPDTNRAGLAVEGRF